ncbi:MAG: phytanoyl-CoA dioxygenase family protein, partial [Candidatus Marinimicrobia bacterium]|nr:phytanoyl-CoA dioxygenase family protein [Candidatus Neomarinimicrobiota bacterium]
KTGTMVVLHGLLPHMSYANRSARTRNAYTLHLIEGTANYPEWNWLQRPPEMPLCGF